MTDARFEKFWPRLLKYEGGYVNDKDDSGGETKYGISRKAYPKVDIVNLTEQQAKDIFYRDYYTPLSIEAIVDDRIAWQIFDFGVNAGIVKAAMLIQKIVGAKVDGNIGPKTVNFINLYEEYDYPLWVLYATERAKYYLNLAHKKPKNMKFLKGWILRAMEL